MQHAEYRGTPATQGIAGRLVRYERLNLALIYLNSLLFSALFSFDSFWVFLVRAVFNGSGIIMVLGLISLIAGNLVAGARHTGGRFALFGSYYSTVLLLALQVLMAVALVVWVGVKFIS